MADEQQEPVEVPELAEEILDEEVYIVVAEKLILDLLREAALPGSDPDMLYAEFWANSQIQQVIEMCDDCACECCDCDEDDDDCECECVCVVAEDEEEDADGETE